MRDLYGDIPAMVADYNAKAAALEQRLNEYGTLLQFSIDRARLFTWEDAPETLSHYTVRATVTIAGRKCNAQYRLPANYLDGGHIECVAPMVASAIAREVVNFVLMPPATVARAPE